jgi:hypothetical protein
MDRVSPLAAIRPYQEFNNTKDMRAREKNDRAVVVKGDLRKSYSDNRRGKTKRG